MRLLRLQSVVCLCIVTTIVLTESVPESSDADAVRSKRQVSAVADKILPVLAFAFVVSLLLNVGRITAENYTPGLWYTF